MSEVRYQRNKSLINSQDQTKLAGSCVAVIGLGGLGGNTAEQLARLGIGKLILIDRDCFDETNLNRQLFATEKNIGQRKVDGASDRLMAINSSLHYEFFDGAVTADNAKELLNDAQIVVDSVDNIKTRRLLQTIWKTLDLPLVYGAIGGWYGQVSFIAPGDDTLNLVYPGTEEVGIEQKLGNPAFTPAIVSSIQVAEVVKYLLGKGELLRKKLLLIDLLNQDYSVLDLDI